MGALLRPVERRRASFRRRSDATLMPLNTFDHPPAARDADGNGLVLAFMLGTWSAESWRFVAEHPMSAPYWMPMSALPMPWEE